MTPPTSARLPQAALVLWAALLVWACTILWLSSLSPQELPDSAFMFWDKVNHVAAFAIGGWLAASALRVSRPHMKVASAVLIAIGGIAAFGVLDETVQTFTPGRTGGNVDDWVADALGATTGALLTLPTLPRLLRRRAPEHPRHPETSAAQGNSRHRRPAPRR